MRDSVIVLALLAAAIYVYTNQLVAVWLATVFLVGAGVACLVVAVREVLKMVERRNA